MAITEPQVEVRYVYVDRSPYIVADDTELRKEIQNLKRENARLLREIHTLRLRRR